MIVRVAIACWYFWDFDTCFNSCGDCGTVGRFAGTFRLARWCVGCELGIRILLLANFVVI